MKKFLISLISIVAFLGAVFFLTSYSNQANSMRNTGGAPAGYTGSPSDGRTCTNCHSGSAATNQTGWITSDIPVDGYVPNTTYTITATADGVGSTKFGFQVSPQDASGILLGTLVSTSAETQLVGSDKYITHTSSGTNGTDSKTWTFDWTAPAAETGSVTFYGAFNVSNANGGSSGDIIYTSSLTVDENTGIGISDNHSISNNVLIYPNPISDQINIQYSLLKSANVEIKLFDLQGKLCKILLSEIKNASNYTTSFDIGQNEITKGVYLVETTIGNRSSTQKIIVQ
jgi:hypothetical protein